jgi:acyl carrier protein
MTDVDDRSEDDIRESVQAIVVELAPGAGDDANADSRLIEDLGFHSLALLELAFTLEDEFNLPPIDEQTAQKITTVGSIAEHVVSTMRGSGALVG